MDDLALDLCCYGPQSWSAEVWARGSSSYVASATGTTAHEARDAVLAQLTPEQLADLRESMISDLAAVAKAMGYRCKPSGGRVITYNADGPLCDASAYTIQYTRRQLLGYALALDTLRREQEAADG